MASVPDNTVVKIGRDTTVNHLLEPLREYLERPGVTEVCVNRPGEVFTECNNVWERFYAPQLDFHRLRSIGVAVAAYTRNELSDTQPILSAVLPGDERMQVVIPPACEEGTISVTLRKPSKSVITLDDYIKNGYFSHVKQTPTLDAADYFSRDERELIALFNQRDFGAFLRSAIKYELNIIVAGATGSGKTTFMKGLMNEIPHETRLVTIEDVRELFLPFHPNHVHLFYPSEAKASDGAPVTASTLLKSCMRMKPDRILLAELRGGETYDFIKACSSGHGGSITSIHAGSPRLAFERMADMALENEYAKQTPRDIVTRLLYMLVDVVVHIHNDKHGLGRHVTDIWFDPLAKITGKDNQTAKILEELK